MKKLLICLIIYFVFNLTCFAQNGVAFHPYPGGYALGYLRFKNDMQVDSQQNLWIAFRDIGLGKYNGSSWTMYDTINSNIPSNTVNAITFDSQQQLWAATAKGLVKFDGVTWVIYDSINSGLPGSFVFAVKYLGNKIWCGTNFGAATFDGVSWNVYNNTNSGIAGDSVRAFQEGLNGEVWLGTANMGISRFYNNLWVNYNNTNSGYTNEPVLKLEVDANNDLFILTSTYNLFKITGTTVNNFLVDLYDGVVPVAKINYSFTRDLSGKIVFPLFPFFGFVYLNEINGFEFKMSTANLNTPIASSGSIRPVVTCDQNNVIWIGAVFDSSGTFGLISFDRSQNINVLAGITNTNSKFLDINGVRAAMLNRGDMHWDLTNHQYEVPKGSGKHSVFASDLWMGGIDNAGQLHVAAQNYRQSGDDYWPGPIDTVSGASDSITASLYDRIWKVNRSTIEDFKYYFANGSVGNGTYPVPEEIATWPAQGSGNLSRNLAPFVDFNADGLYNPLDGDYPLIKGDQMLYWIMNDNLAAHTLTDTLPLGIEIHASAYAYSCSQLPDSEQVMDHTTLYQYRIINRSNSDYHNFYIGIYCDMDLGNAIDDEIGCDTILNAGFTYNGDNNDDTFDGYGLNPPIQNVKILKGPVADFADGSDNNHNGIIDEPNESCMMSGFMTYNGINNTINGEPSSGIDFYNYLQSNWLDGQHMTYGYDGTYNGPGAFLTNFIYNGDPYDTNGWWGGGVGILPGDRRLLLSSGPFTLPAGGEKTIDFAYVFSRDTTGPNGLNTSIAKNKSDLKKIQDWFDNNNFPSCLVINPGINQPGEYHSAITVSPNPAADQINIDWPKSATFISYRILDVTGRMVLSGHLKHNMIDIRKLSNGLYFLEINYPGEAMKAKFVKQ